jgi:high affinity sulfate transporter 1
VEEDQGQGAAAEDLHGPKDNIGDADPLRKARLEKGVGLTASASIPRVPKVEDQHRPAAGKPPLVLRLAPGLYSFRRRRWEEWRADLVAGVTLSAYLLPAGIGDASLAGLPPEAGVYACLFAGLVFWLFSSSKQTAVTVTSAISLLIGTSLGGLDGGDPSRHGVLAAVTALMAGALALAAWAAKAGTLVSFVSESVMVGFKAGVAFQLAASQLPKLLGFKGGHGDFWERSHHILAHLGETQPASLLLGLSALALLLAGKVFLPARPVALVVVIAGIALVPLLGLRELGVKTLGEIPRGIPVPGLPAARWSDVNDVFPLAVACFLLGAVETTAIGRMFGRKHRYRLDSSQEFLALAASNLASAFGQGFPVSGGMSQSLVNEAAGARSSVSGLVATLILGLVALFLTGLLGQLPQPVLAAVVLAAVTGLLKVSELRRLWQLSRQEFAVAAIAFLGVLGSGLLHGVLIGALVSLLLVIRRASRPRTAELGRVPGTEYFADLVRHPENEREEDVLVFRTEAALMYFNVEYVREKLEERLAARSPGVRLLVLFFGTVPAIDVAGLEFLEELEHGLEARGIALRMAEAHGQVRELLLRAGFERRGVPVVPNQPVTTVIAEWRSGGGR